jgi:hypothetical protein
VEAPRLPRRETPKEALMPKPSKSRKTPRTAQARKVRPASPKARKTARRTATSPKAGTLARAGTKQALLIDLLQRPGGATIAEIVEATGWQAHSVRGAISGTLKKKLGLKVTSEKSENGLRRYRIVATKG